MLFTAIKVIKQLNYKRSVVIVSYFTQPASKLYFKVSFNPLSPNIHIQILQTDLYTFC